MSDFKDRVEIQELIHRYHDAINHRDFTALEALFTEDAVWEVSAFSLRYEGRANIVAGLSEGVRSLELLVQSCSPIVVELGGIGLLRCGD